MIHTDVCDRIGIEYPIFQGGMAWVLSLIHISRLPRVHARQRQQAADERGHLTRAQADVSQRLGPCLLYTSRCV